jgi:hypothetical protein
MKKILFFIVIIFWGNIIYAQNIPPYIPDSGLLAWYPFTGNAVDSSGNGHNGTVNDATLTTDRFGNADCAYMFDGVTSNISTSLLPPTGHAARTISCWFKYNSLPQPCQSNMTIAGYGGNTHMCTDAGENFSLELDYTNMPPAPRIDGVCIFTQTIDSVNNNWHFFVAEYDSSFGPNFSNIHLYVDGILQQDTTVSYISDSSVNTGNLTDFLIGESHIECARYFLGKIDDIGVWDRALTQTEITGIYNGGGTTGISNISKEASPNIVPNPANGVIKVTAATQIETIQIMDMLGQIIFTGDYNSKNIIVDVSSFSNGIYLVKVNGVFVQKLVKQ